MDNLLSIGITERSDKDIRSDDSEKDRNSSKSL
jgi:hypothetical protein